MKAKGFQRSTLMHDSTLLSIADKQINLAMIPSELKNVIFIASVVASLGLIAFLVSRRFPAIVEFLRESRQHLANLISGERREARLHKVICHHCQKGMGVYNPIYRTMDGISYIEGTCSNCGTYIRARLR